MIDDETVNCYDLWPSGTRLNMEMEKNEEMQLLTWLFAYV